MVFVMGVVLSTNLGKCFIASHKAGYMMTNALLRRLVPMLLCGMSMRQMRR